MMSKCHTLNRKSLLAGGARLLSFLLLLNNCCSKETLKGGKNTQSCIVVTLTDVMVRAVHDVVIFY